MKTQIEAQAKVKAFDFTEWKEFRFVFWMLMLRDIKLRYKQTALGIAWVILQPLSTALLFTFLFGRILNTSSEGLPYILFAFCGLIPWLVFSQSLQRANGCLINDTRLITKVYFPRIFIPLSATCGVVIDYLIALTIMGILLGIYGKFLTLHALMLPLATALLFLFSSGVNLLFSSLNVYYRDIKHIVPFLLQFWMYASPLAYSSQLIPPRYLWLYQFNPLVGIIDLFRWTLLGTAPFPAVSSCITLILIIGLFFTGLSTFRKLERNLADYI